MTVLQPIVRGALWAGLGVAVLVTAGCAGWSQRSNVVLGGDKEVPQVTTTASGTTDISARPTKCPGSQTSSVDCNGIHGNVWTTGIAATAVHVHQGAKDQNGPVIVTLYKVKDGEWAIPQGTTLNAAQYQAYWDGQLYVNVHSDANKGGEIRGQLVAQ